MADFLDPLGSAMRERRSSVDDGDDVALISAPQQQQGQGGSGDPATLRSGDPATIGKGRQPAGGPFAELSSAGGGLLLTQRPDGSPPLAPPIILHRCSPPAAAPPCFAQGTANTARHGVSKFYADRDMQPRQRNGRKPVHLPAHEAAEEREEAAQGEHRPRPRRLRDSAVDEQPQHAPTQRGVVELHGDRQAGESNGLEQLRALSHHGDGTEEQAEQQRQSQMPQPAQLGAGFITFGLRPTCLEGLEKKRKQDFCMPRC
eukprot:gene31817-54484_t